MIGPLGGWKLLKSRHRRISHLMRMHLLLDLLKLPILLEWLSRRDELSRKGFMVEAILHATAILHMVLWGLCNSNRGTVIRKLRINFLFDILGHYFCDYFISNLLVSWDGLSYIFILVHWRSFTLTKVEFLNRTSPIFGVLNSSYFSV